MQSLTAVNKISDILAEYRNSPVETLLAYHNLEMPFNDYTYTSAQLLIVMCMDHRKTMRIPDNFAYILRTGGASTQSLDFKISYAVAIGQVSAIALIGHNDCGMENLSAKRANFICGLVQNGGWTTERATEHFDHMAPFFEIDNAADFIVQQASRLRQRYPKILVAPIMYLVEDKRLYLM